MGVRYEPSMRQKNCCEPKTDAHSTLPKRHVIAPSYDIGTPAAADSFARFSTKACADFHPSLVMTGADIH
jgi:hypothetical protein